MRDLILTSMIVREPRSCDILDQRYVSLTVYVYMFVRS